MTHTAIKVYGVPISVHTRKIIVAAQVKGIPFELLPVSPVDTSSLPANWSSISPTGLIPVISDGGFSLFDSTAILLYLEQKVPEPALIPRDAKLKATALSLDAWAGSELFRKVNHPIFHNQVVAPMLRNQPGDKAAIDAALTRDAPKAFSYLEQTLAGGQLVGQTPSIADLAVVSNLLLFNYLGHRVDEARFPNLARYFQQQLVSSLFESVLKQEKPVVERMGLDTWVLS